ncbi:hypothetical protein Sjap_013969 [Stephania japonica]|uniref:Laccase n=1 Tax=Stephania japonica TaxID=461633 RepID=A0AAP0J0X9_9MAGN
MYISNIYTSDIFGVQNNMARIMIFSLAIVLGLLASSSSAAVVEHTFDVANFAVTRLCQSTTVAVVNNSLPGPTIHVHEGDTLVVHVNNKSPYNISIHWHGVFQLNSGWADGPGYITQCPIRPGNSYTYRFNITRQEGTLWWHAHVSVLRATVYGALLIQPKLGRNYPFRRPYREVPIILGEWWKRNPVDVDREALGTGSPFPAPDAYTINGQPGHRYNCSSNEMFRLTVEQGRTYLLRIINAALNNQLFFKLAGHRFTVVAIDAAYTNPYETDVLVLAPGQTIDVLITTNQAPGNYYMAASTYSTSAAPFNDNFTSAVLHYATAPVTATPQLPPLPNVTDTPTAHRFYTSLTGLTTSPFWSPPPREVDESMFVTVGVGAEACGADMNCSGSPLGPRFRLAANMNNVSFQFPTSRSMLEAFHFNINGTYTEDFPNRPPVEFNYTDEAVSRNFTALWVAPRGTKVKKLKYNATVEVVLQNTAILTTENHPIHFHGLNFHVLAQGFGNFNEGSDRRSFNLVNPQERNTIAVPDGGWAVIRFRANNPGVWFVHCHLDVHLPWGLAMAFAIENGPTPSTSLPPPPSDLPRC